MRNRLRVFREWLRSPSQYRIARQNEAWWDGWREGRRIEAEQTVALLRETAVRRRGDDPSSRAPSESPSYGEHFRRMVQKIEDGPAESRTAIGNIERAQRGQKGGN